MIEIKRTDLLPTESIKSVKKKKKKKKRWGRGQTDNAKEFTLPFSYRVISTWLTRRQFRTHICDNTAFRCFPSYPFPNRTQPKTNCPASNSLFPGVSNLFPASSSPIHFFLISRLCPSQMFSHGLRGRREFLPILNAHLSSCKTCASLLMVSVEETPETRWTSSCFFFEGGHFLLFFFVLLLSFFFNDADFILFMHNISNDPWNFILPDV